MRDEGKSMELLPRKPIINQVEKTQFDYDIVAATVSAYSDIVSETVSADHLFYCFYCTGRGWMHNFYIFFFFFFQKIK
jgi:hypothetical protein